MKFNKAEKELLDLLHKYYYEDFDNRNISRLYAELQRSDNRNELSSILLKLGVNPTDYLSAVYREMFNHVDFYACDVSELAISNKCVLIDMSAFEYARNLNKLVIPGSIKKIDINAFFNMDNLYELEYTGTVADWCKINFKNFSANPLMVAQHATIGGQLIDKSFNITGTSYIKAYAFSNSLLKYCKIHNDVQIIEHNAFNGCKQLIAVELTEGLKQIDVYAFSNCGELRNITIPSSVETVSVNAFEGCTNLIVNCKSKHYTKWQKGWDNDVVKVNYIT